MRMIRVVLLFAIFVLCAGQLTHPATAQDQAQLSLQISTTTLQTGQAYPVDIRVTGVKELWLANVELTYDPALIYVVGTKAGSPVKGGTFLTPAESSIVVRNQVKEEIVSYAASMLAPADPVSGDGLLGTLMIYPIAPGKTEIRFSRAELVKVNFGTDEAGQRVGTDTVSMPVLPILLQLTITGDKVDPPSEATATPVPTETPTPTEPGEGVTVRTRAPTLINVTAAPTAVPTLGTLEPPSRGDSSGALLISLGLIAISIIGLLIVLGLWMRSRRR